MLYGFSMTTLGLVLAILTGFFGLLTVLSGVASGYITYRSGVETEAQTKVFQEQLSAAHAKVADLEAHDADAHSLKNRIRGLFNTVDTNIVRAIDDGAILLPVRLPIADAQKLQALVAEAGGKELVRGIQFGRRISPSATISNGSLGPSGSGLEQIETTIEITAQMKAK